MRCFLLAGLLALVATPVRADKLVLVAGGGDGPDGGPAATARVVQPFGVDFTSDGALHLVEMVKGERVRVIDAAGVIRTVAGEAGEKGDAGDGGPGPKARFNGMHSLAVGPNDVLYLADTWNNRVRTFDPRTGTVAAFAGTGEKGFAGDGGPAARAKFGGCFCVSFDPARKNLYVTDLDNRRVRKVELGSGVVTTAAGNGQRGVPRDDELATAQPLVDPRAHAVDAKGDLYVLERGGHALRVVDAGGKIRTAAGTGKAGAGGLGGPALQAQMNGPKHLAIDRDGTVLIADTENHRILRYSPETRTLTLVAGIGKKGTGGVGGNPLLAELNQPHGVTVHPRTGELYISDAGSGRVLKLVKE